MHNVTNYTFNYKQRINKKCMTFLCNFLEIFLNKILNLKIGNTDFKINLLLKFIFD